MPDSLRDQLIEKARRYRQFSGDTTTDIVDALLPLIQAHAEAECVRRAAEARQQGREAAAEAVGAYREVLLASISGDEVTGRTMRMIAIEWLGRARYLAHGRGVPAAEDGSQ